MFPVNSYGVILQGWSFRGQIPRICDVSHLQVIRPLIPLGVVVLASTQTTMVGLPSTFPLASSIHYISHPR